MKLHQFPISHYCEKIRWALDYKKLDYEVVNYLPGRHIRPIKALSGQTSVPVLTHGDQIISGSADIISWLDEQFPERSLTPADPALKQQALEWERRLDEKAGPAVRLWTYHYLLTRPELVVPLLIPSQPFWLGWLLRLKFKDIDKGMRRWMNINEQTAEVARTTMEGLLDELRHEYSASHFLVGESFSRADLTACSLFAMTYQPKAYPVPWPALDKLPQPMQQWLGEHRDYIEPLHQRYQQYR